MFMGEASILAFIARQKKRLEKEGAPLAVRGFPRYPQPLACPGLPQTGRRTPRSNPSSPPGEGEPGARTGPILSRGQRKNRPRSRRDEQRGGQYSNCCTARRIGGGGERSERRAWGQPHPQGRGGRGARHGAVTRKCRKCEKRYILKGDPGPV